MKFSLISTVRNEIASIETLLNSILNQSRPADEVIIVDGGSTDGTTDVIKSYIAKGALIRLIVTNDIGIGRGRNVAIRNASYGYIACVDAGCRLDKDWLKNLLKPFEEDRKVDVVYGFYLPDPKTPFEECLAKLLYPRIYENVRYGTFLPSSACMAFTKECHEKVGGYPEGLSTGEDNLFNVRLKQAGFKFCFAKNAVIYWRPRSDLRSLFKQYFSYAQGCVQTNTSPDIRHLSLIMYFFLKRTLSLFKRGRVEYLLYYPLIALTVPIAHLVGRLTAKTSSFQKLKRASRLLSDATCSKDLNHPRDWGEDSRAKVLMLSHRFPPAVGGGEMHAYLLSKGLVTRMHDVTVYTTNSLSNIDVLSLSNTLIKRPMRLRAKTTLPLIESIEGIKVRRFDIKFRFWSLNWIPELFRELLMGIEEFDLVHAHGYHIFTSVVACYLAKRRNAPFVLTAHDMKIPPTLPLTAKILKFIYDRIFGSFLISNSTLLIALTEDQIEKYLSLGGMMEKIRIIPNAIELDKYAGNVDFPSDYRTSPHDKTLLFVGRIEKYKGIADVIEVMPKILKEEPDVRFIIVGDDWGGREELEKLVKKLRLDDKVIFTGELNEEKLIQLYKLADIFVFPSKSEAFGIVLLEAMASEKLCIAYAISSVRRVIRHGETGILVNDKAELLRKIVYFLRNKDEAEEIVKRARVYVKNYSTDTVMEKIEAVYTEALRSKLMSGK